MLGTKIQEAINKQINAELYSAYLYFSMSAHFESTNMPGCANWMRVQGIEEMTHAAKLFDFVNQRGGRVLLTAIDAPPGQWDSPLAAFRDAYEHERKVTGLIGKLVDLADAENDHATNVLLQWFVTEQVEEEASADKIVQKLKLIGDNPQALFMLDSELAQRTFTPQAQAEQ